MSKKQGALSGFLGGVVFAILLRFSETAVFQIRILLNRLFDFPFPLYETLQHSPEAESIVNLAFVIILVPLNLLVWTDVGIVFAILDVKQIWSQKTRMLAWVLWGFFPPLLFLFLRLVIFRCDGEIKICQAEFIAGVIWALFAGLMGSLVSALYVLRQPLGVGNMG